MKSYLFLFLAIVFEIIGTTYLKKSEQFTLWKPAVVTVAGYLAAFYFLSLTLKTMPVGIAYAIWSGVGIILITIVGIIVFKQHLDTAPVIGLALITSGVIVINVFSKMTAH